MTQESRTPQEKSPTNYDLFTWLTTYQPEVGKALKNEQELLNKYQRKPSPSDGRLARMAIKVFNAFNESIISHHQERISLLTTQLEMTEEAIRGITHGGRKEKAISLLEFMIEANCTDAERQLASTRLKNDPVIMPRVNKLMAKAEQLHDLLLQHDQNSAIKMRARMQLVMARRDSK